MAKYTYKALMEVPRKEAFESALCYLEWGVTFTHALH